MKKFLKKKLKEFQKHKNKNVIIKKFLCEYFDINIEYNKSYENILKSLLETHLFSNNMEIDFLKCQCKLLEIMLNYKEQIQKVNKFKESYKMFLDDNGNDYFGTSIENIEYVVINNKDKIFNVDDINCYVENCSPTIIFRNDNFYILHTSTDNLFDTRDDLILNSNNNPIKFKKIHNIKELNMKNRGKDWIKHYICEKFEQGTLYFLTLKYNNQLFYKAGITKFNVEKRYSNLQENIQIIESFEYIFSMLECSIIEKYIHENNRLIKEIPDLEFEGKTECYFNNIHLLYKDKMNNLLNLALEYLDSINYPISSKLLKEIIKEKQ